MTGEGARLRLIDLDAAWLAEALITLHKLCLRAVTCLSDKDVNELGLVVLHQYLTALTRLIGHQWARLDITDSLDGAVFFQLKNDCA